MELKSKLLNNRRGLYLYGTTPPRQSLSSEKIYALAEKLTARLSGRAAYLSSSLAQDCIDLIPRTRL